MSLFDLQIIRNKPNVIADATDYVGTQAIAAFDADNEGIVLESVGGDQSVRCMITYEWLDVGGAVVAGGDRGTATLQIVRKLERPNNGTAMLEDGVTEAGVPAFRPMIDDDMVIGDTLGVTVTAASPPVGAVSMRFYLRVLPRG